MKKAIIAVLALNLIGLGWLGWKSFHKKVAYVNNAKVYEAFDLTAAYRTQLETYQKSRQTMLDSLEMNVRNLEAKLMVDSTNRVLQQNYRISANNYYSNLKSFDEEGQRLASEYDRQIWDKLNTLLLEYGKDEGLELLLGANGTGVILHADGELDVTSDVVEYVNNKLKADS